MQAFSRFLERLRTVESGIDLSAHEFYVRNYRELLMDYAEVISPGRVQRDPASGDWITSPATVGDFFERVGVAEHFERSDPTCLRRMQYRVINPLGYVGYQIGEAVLIETGYYRAERVEWERESGREELDRYYIGLLDNANWRGGRREILHHRPDRAVPMIGTDVNRWQGTFSGKNGVGSFEDLMVPELQERVMLDVFGANYAVMEQALAGPRDTLTEVVKRPGKEVACLVESASRGTDVTVSGLLGAAHLCGALSVVNLMRAGEATRDEIGTSIVRYLTEFSGYETPFDDHGEATRRAGSEH